MAKYITEHLGFVQLGEDFARVENFGAYRPLHRRHQLVIYWHFLAPYCDENSVCDLFDIFSDCMAAWRLKI